MGVSRMTDEEIGAEIEQLQRRNKALEGYASHLKAANERLTDEKLNADLRASLETSNFAQLVRSYEERIAAVTEAVNRIGNRVQSLPDREEFEAFKTSLQSRLSDIEYIASNK